MSTVRTTFQLSGLHCESCKKITEKNAGKIDGVEIAEVELASGQLTIVAQREISKDEVSAVLADTDYQVI